MSWLFSGKKPDPTPPKNDARRPSGVVPTPAPAASSVNLNAKGFGGYDAPKPTGFGFIAPPTPDAPVAPAPATSGFGFSFVSSEPVVPDVAAVPPASGFSFAQTNAVSNTAPAAVSGFSFGAPVEPAEPASRTASNDSVLGGLSFVAPPHVAEPVQAVPLFPAAAEPPAAPVPLFGGTTALKANTAIKKKKPVKKIGFAREDEGEEHQSAVSDALVKSGATSAAESPFAGLMVVAESPSRPPEPLNDLKAVNNSVPGLRWSNEPAPAPVPAPVSSLLAGLTLKQPVAVVPQSISSHNSPEPDAAPAATGFSFLAPSAHIPTPKADTPPPEIVDDVQERKQPVPLNSECEEEIEREHVESVVVSQQETPSPHEVACEPKDEVDVEAEVEGAVSPPTALPFIVQQASPPGEVPVSSGFSFVTSESALPEKFEVSLDSILEAVNRTADATKARLVALREQKRGIIRDQDRFRAQIQSTREALRKSEADQNAAIEVEDFAKAESLDAAIASLRSEVESVEAALSQCGARLAVVDQEIEAQFQAGVDLANTTAQRLQELVEVKSEELSSFKEQSAKAVSALSDKIANEEEQLRMKREHVELDEKLVQEEQQQVDDAIEGQTSENLALARELEEKHVMLDMEIAELEAKLERLRQEDASTVAKLAEVREKVTSIRGKYSKQLDRLKAKRSVVDSEKRECQAEADGIARERRELEVMTEQDSENIQAATAHIATAKKEASVSENLVDTLADFAEKRRQRLAGAASAAAATLASVKANLERSIAELQRECDKRDQLDAVIVGCRDAIVAIDAKLPVLNEEKKAVVAARKFKDAARVQADIKQLTDEKTEQEAKLAETVKTVEDTDAVIEKLKDSIETCRKNVASLEAEADMEKVRVLRSTVVAIKRAIAKLSGINNCSDVQTAAAGVALLEAELELALDELTLLCEKFNMALEIPESVDVEDDRGDRSSQSLPQAAGSETVLAESVPVNMVGAEAESVETQSAVVEDSQVEAPETKPEAPAQIVPARTAEETQAEIDGLRARASELEGEVENAIAAEDFDQADRLQADLDAANAQISQLETELAALLA